MYVALQHTPNISDDLAGEKYLKDICTMKGCTDKNVIFYFFTRHYLITPHTKFHVIRPPLHVFCLYMTYFFLQIFGGNICLDGFAPAKIEMINFGSKLSKISAITFKNV